MEPFQRLTDCSLNASVLNFCWEFNKFLVISETEIIRLHYVLFLVKGETQGKK